jgi:alpha-L-rhamnosidase
MKLFLSLTWIAALFPICMAQAKYVPPTVDPTYGLPIPKSVRFTSPAKDAKWIWTSQTRDTQTILARTEFQLSSIPPHSILYITTDNFFKAWVNGHLVASSHPVPGNDLVWQTVQHADVTRYLNKGENVIAVRGQNDGGAAGIIARLESHGKPIALSGGNWKVDDTATEPNGWKDAGFDASDWQNATVEADINSGVWAGQLQGWPNANGGVNYLAYMPILPVKVIDLSEGDGRITDADSVTGKNCRLVVRTPPADSQNPPQFVIDFGKELAGRIEITLKGPGTVEIGTGESEGEALNGPWGGLHTLTTTTGGLLYTPWSAFRYAHIVFPGEGTQGATIEVSKLLCNFKYYPVTYKGSFESSDPLLNKIWYTGAYTAHLCMQEDIWDAPKRDRARWMGDLQVSGEVINNVFADKFLMEQTMERLRASKRDQLVNGIPGYSCAWVAGLADFYRHIGDKKYLMEQHDALLTTIQSLKDEENSEHLFANKLKQWPFVDWSPGFNGDTPLARQATQFYMIKAAKEAAFLLHAMGDDANAEMATRWAEQLTAAAQAAYVKPDGAFSDRRQDNSMAIYAGAATPAEETAIWDNVLKPGSKDWSTVVTPYYNNYVIFAMSMIGHTQSALNFVRKYWGGMIDEGATTFWEGYDPSWPKVHFHKYLQADNGMGYFVSLCHGWSAGATNFLTERILGVRPTSGGFRTCVIEPNLCDLKWVKGTVPAPDGEISVAVNKVSDGMKMSVSLPRNVTAIMRFPGCTVLVDGKKERTDEATLNGSGKWTVKVLR